MKEDGVHVCVVGQGTPVVVLHGGMGLDHNYFRPWMDRVAARLVYLDHIGNGLSPDPSDWEAFGVEEWCAGVDEVREAAGCDRAIVLGHSAAGFLALEYARRYPDRVAGLVLVGATPVFDYGEELFAAASARASAEQMASLTTLFTASIFDDEEFKRHYMAVLPLYFSCYDPAFGEHVRNRVRFHARAFLHSRDQLLAVCDTRLWLGGVTAPALVVVGDDDLFTPLDAAARRLATGLADAELAVVEAAGHFPFVEQPERFAATVGDWIARRVTGLRGQ